MSLVALALLVALAAPPPAAPVALTLRGYEYVPSATRPSAETLATWRQVAADAQEDPVIRGRALTLLSLQANPADAVLARALLAPTSAPILRRKAVVALARVQGAAALPELEALYRAAPTDTKLRAACAQALLVLGPPAAALRARLRRIETDPEIRGRLAPVTPQRRVP
jgi:hypothetical protein